MTRLKAQILLITTALLLPKLATAQGYTNVTADWSDIYTDVWDEAAPPVSCPSYVYIYSTINGIPEVVRRPTQPPSTSRSTHPPRTTLRTHGPARFRIMVSSEEVTVA